MADFRSIIVFTSGDQKQIANADTLVVGSGSKTLAGDYSLTAATGLFNLVSVTIATFTGAGSPRSILTNVAATTDALTVRTGNATAGASGALSLASGTATVGFASGAVSITTGASPTTSGAITLDVGAAAATGAINIGTVTATAITVGVTGGTLVLDGTTLTLKTAGTNRLIATAGTLTVQAGTTLTTTGTGTINLPSTGAGSASNFQIGGTAISGTAVTAANFNKIFDNSNADGLHFHTANGPMLKIAGEALTAGAIVALDNNGGAANVFLADADSATAVRKFPVGFSTAAFGATVVATIQTTGEIAVPDVQWITVPAAADVGKRAYLSQTPGKITFDAATDVTASGANVIRVGLISAGGAGTSKLAIQFGEGTSLP